MNEPRTPDDRAGQELLVVDADETIRRGLGRLFQDLGMTVTALSDPERARDQIANRFYPVALIDLDTPTELEGLKLLEFAKQKSPLTSVIIMTGRQTFEAVAPAFRAGATDVVLKLQAQVPYLRDRVLAASDDVRDRMSRDRVLAEVSDFHDEFLRKMVEMQRQVTDLEDRLFGRDESQATPVGNPDAVNLLLVDDEDALASFLEKSLPPDQGWRLRRAQSGGEALDFATQSAPQIAVVKEQLPDLAGSMVLKTLKATAPDIVGILFTPPRGTESGDVRLLENSKFHTLLPAYSEPTQLLASLKEIRGALRRNSKERRYLSIFRKQHFEFLKRFNILKQKLGKPPAP